ncbi:F0F1 ATP synthase subunit delta [Oceanobacillus piezotolerans]|uniref:ATP synthase subunit delta n=1 Tax=Oceanobacillus piezotolerans TaxID=2448030 RepID=A0A498DFY0_9BACI|nr:F0F1 ATP synthase subunit delta [Oceanobacillus piezotolerans]RLL42908.1 F0F1 ATP synthase subunit delta [Oceanobacillus piezotolerans]
MSDQVVAKRYADALFVLGQEKLSLDKFVEEFKVVRQIFEDNEKLNTFLFHPGINKEQKKLLLTEAFQGMHQDVVNTLKLLVDRHRTELIPSIIDHFVQVVNDAKGIAEAYVYSVRELTGDEKVHLKAAFTKRLNKGSIQFTNIVDPTLIGGVKIRIGNTIYDGSVSGKLKRIERNIGTANN